MSVFSLDMKSKFLRKSDIADPRLLWLARSIFRYILPINIAGSLQNLLTQLCNPTVTKSKKTSHHTKQMVKKHTGKDKMMGDKMKSMEMRGEEIIDRGQQINARQQESRQDK